MRRPHRRRRVAPTRSIRASLLEFPLQLGKFMPVVLVRGAGCRRAVRTRSRVHLLSTGGYDIMQHVLGQLPGVCCGDGADCRGRGFHVNLVGFGRHWIPCRVS